MRDIRTQPTPDSHLGRCVDEIQKEASLHYLGRAVISSQQFKYWPWITWRTDVYSSSRHLFFVLPEHNVLVELSLGEEYGPWDAERWSWQRNWKVVLHGIVPWEHVEVAEFNLDAPDDALHMRSHNGAKWYDLGRFSGIGRRSPIRPGNGDLQAVTAEYAVYDPEAENLGSTEFKALVARSMKTMLERSGLLRHALKGRLSHLQDMLPDPDVWVTYKDCANAFWAQYPREALFQYCEMPVCGHEYTKHVRIRRNSHYREFLHGLRKSDRELARKIREGSITL